MWWLLLAGVALAWSIVTRWGQAALVLVWIIVAFAEVRFWSRTVSARSLLLAGLALLPALAILGVQLALVWIVKPGAGLGPHPFAGDLGLISGSGWSLPHLLQHGFVNADGSQTYALPNLMFYLTAPFRERYLTPLSAPAVLYGMWLVASRYRSVAPLLIGWPVVLLVLYAGLTEQNIRFVLAALPPVAILAGIGVSAAWESLAPRFRPAGLGVLVGALLTVAASGLHDADNVLSAVYRSDRHVAAWVVTRVPKRVPVATFGITLTLQHMTHLRVVDLSAVSPQDLRRLARWPLYVLVRVGSMKQQWAAQTPGINFHFLSARIGIVQVGETHGYTLFETKT